MSAQTLPDLTMYKNDDLVVRAQGGDEKALNQLVSLWYKRIYNFVLKYCSDHDLATELTQTTFIAMFKNIKKLKEVDRFKPWIYRIATNFCYEENRKKKRNKLVSLTISKNDEEEVVEVGTAEGHFYNPERSFQQNELERVIFSALQELSEHQRSVVIMKEYEGLKFREIAEAMGESENTVKTWLYRGLRNLKDILNSRNLNKETLNYEL